MKRTLGLVWGIIARPLPTFRRIDKEKPSREGIVVFAILLCLESLAKFYLLNPPWKIVKELAFGLLTLFTIVIALNLIAIVFKGKSNIKLLITSCFFIYPLFFIKTFLDSTLLYQYEMIIDEIILLVWVFILLVMAIKEINHLSIQRSIGAVSLVAVIAVVSIVIHAIPNFVTNFAFNNYCIFPNYVTITEDDFIYVTSIGSERVFKFDSSGKLIKRFQFKPMPEMNLGVKVGPDETFYFLDIKANTVKVFNAKGDLIQEIRPVLKIGLGSDEIAVDAEGNLYAVERKGKNSSKMVKKLDREGNEILRITSAGKEELCSIKSIDVDYKGNLYILDLGKSIHKFNSEGEFLKSFTIGEETKGGNYNSIISDYTIDKTGNLYVLIRVFDRKAKEFVSSEIKKIGLDGKLSEAIIGGKGVFIINIAVDGEENIYMTVLYYRGVIKCDSWGKRLPAITSPFIKTRLGKLILKRFDSQLRNLSKAASRSSARK